MSEEIKNLADKIQEATKALHDEAELYRAQIAKDGVATAESKVALEKANARIDDLEVKLQRQSLPGHAEGKDPAKTASTAAFYKWVREGKSSMAPEERKALVEDATGQIMVEPELDADIMRSLPKITLMRNLATVRTIGKDRIKLRSIGEVSVGWGKLETGTDITESEPTPGTPTYQYVEDLYGLAKIGEDELMDSDINLEALLADSFSRAIAEEEDKQFLLGDGHAVEEPEGITKNATLIAATVTTTAAGAVTAEKFLAMIYAVPQQYRKNGVFIVNSTTELALRVLRGDGGGGAGTGPFLWQPSLIEGRPSTFLGYGMYNQDDMLDLSGTAGVIAAFGDFRSGYRIIDRTGITLQRLVELYSEAGLVGFKVHKRVTGGVMRATHKPIVLLTEYA